MMEDGVVPTEPGVTAPPSGTLDPPALPPTASIPGTSPSVPLSLPPPRPCRPKPPSPGSKSPLLPFPPLLPPSLPPSCPNVSKTPPPLSSSDPPSVPPPLSSSLPPTHLPPPLCPTPVPPPQLPPQPVISTEPSSVTPPPLLLSPTPSPPPAVPPATQTPPVLSTLDRLVGSASVWHPKGISPAHTAGVMETETAGAFLVHSTEEKGLTLSVRLPDQQGAPLIHHLMIRQYKTFVHLDGSCLLFDDIYKLISFYATSRDILTITLKLPRAIAMATKREELEAISMMGADFWTSDLNRTNKQDLDLDLHQNQQTSRLYLYVNPVTVERSPSKDPGPFSVSNTENTTHGNISSSLQNGQPQQKVSPEVKGLNKTTSHREIKYKRPPPRPPSLSSGSGMGLLFSSSPPAHTSPPAAAKKREEGKGRGGEREDRKSPSASPHPARPPVPQQSRAAPPLPPAPLCRTSSRKSTAGDVGEGRGREKGQNPKEAEREGSGERRDQPERRSGLTREGAQQKNNSECRDGGIQKERDEKQEKDVDKDNKQRPSPQCPPARKPSRPVPPPRRKPSAAESPVCQNQAGGGLANHSVGVRVAPPSPARRPDVSLYSPQGGAVTGTDPDSCSTSSAEEEGEPGQDQEQNLNSRPADTRSPKVTVRRTPTTVMLDRARHRLSTVLTGLISHDRRLTQRIVELARDPLSYFGNLVKEHRSFTLESMSKHSSSTELLQEIRQMMTQLKSYLLQSTELQSMLEPQHLYAQDKLESIAEAALCKSVLKPLREAVYQRLEKLHTDDNSLKQLAQNQSVVLGSTTTALGITTAVPEASAMEKISIKLNNLHLEYSPQRKIEMLLKACKIIYDSMSVSSPGRAHGADDFLPVVMYVLARCNLSNLQLDVEYMMELMDPSLALGEGSYYLTTTYGAVEHIKTFDQQRAATRQLSREVQDSIHRWERRRTLNQERMDQQSVRDFLTVCCPDVGTNPRTLGVPPTMTIQQLSEQCAARFERDSYMLSVYIDGVHRPLAPTELAVSVKNSCRPGNYSFVFHPIDQPVPQRSRTCPTDPPPGLPGEVLLPDEVPADEALEPETEEDSLISL